MKLIMKPQATKGKVTYPMVMRKSTNYKPNLEIQKLKTPKWLKNLNLCIKSKLSKAELLRRYPMNMTIQTESRLW